jgi:hypothetical protein
VLPFLVYIPSEARHVERMAVRAKYMTLDPNKNRCVCAYQSFVVVDTWMQGIRVGWVGSV